MVETRNHECPMCGNALDMPGRLMVLPLAQHPIPGTVAPVDIQPTRVEMVPCNQCGAVWWFMPKTHRDFLSEK